MRVNKKSDLAFIAPMSDLGPKEVRGRHPWEAKQKQKGAATGAAINVMAPDYPTYKTGMGECACGCGHRPGCTEFLAIASVGEAD